LRGDFFVSADDRRAKDVKNRGWLGTPIDEGTGHGFDLLDPSEVLRTAALPHPHAAATQANDE